MQIPLQNNSDIFNEDGYHVFNLTDVMVNATEFRLLVRAHVIDSKGCSGKESNFTYKGKWLFILLMQWGNSAYLRWILIYIDL